LQVYFAGIDVPSPNAGEESAKGAFEGIEETSVDGDGSFASEAVGDADEAAGDDPVGRADGATGLPAPGAQAARRIAASANAETVRCAITPRW
jgi:hypothetical protein